MAILLLEKRDCRTCTARQKISYGCEQDAPLPIKFDGEEIKRCPKRPILDNPARFDTVLSYYRHYMKGYLPDAGTILDQGHRYNRLMQVVDQAMDEGKAELQRRT